MNEFSKILKDLFDLLWENPYVNTNSIDLYHSDIHYVQAAINSEAKRRANREDLESFNKEYYSLKETLSLLVEEGLIPQAEKHKYYTGD